MSPPKPAHPGSTISSTHSVHSQGSYVRRAVDNLPKSINRIWALRADIERDHNRKTKRYTGHLGLESYKPHQIEHYVIVRGLVEDFVTECLQRHIIPSPAFNDSIKHRVAMNVEVGVWSDLSGASSDKRLLQLVMEELVLEETRKISVEVAEDVLHLNGILRNLTDFTLMNQAERVSTGRKEGRAPDDPAYNTITKGYFSMIESRNNHRKDLWNHTQLAQVKPRYDDNIDDVEPTTVQRFKTATPEYNTNNNNINNSNARGDEDTTDFDTEVISFNHLVPMELKKRAGSKTDSKESRDTENYTEWYINREVNYWKNMEADIRKVTLSKKCKGIQVIKPSPDNKLMAVGTVHGDILVYDISSEPWRVLRVVHNTSSVDDSVTSIAWSLDTSKLVTVNRMGSMQVWLYNGGGTGKSDARALDIPTDPSGFTPLQLKCLLVLDDDLKDFSFRKGPFSEQGVSDGDESPLKAVFFPTFTFFGCQNSVCVALDNGDVLKCDFEPLLVELDRNQENDTLYLEAPKIYQENIDNSKHGVNLIGRNIEAELLRHHKHPVLYLGFIDKMSTLVTVDTSGFINLWNYERKYLLSYGWFAPYKKYKLDLSKIVYTPDETGSPNVRFTDSNKKKTKTQKEIARERQRVDNILNNMMLGCPWHEEVSRHEGLITSIYPPRDRVKENGSVFNIITRYIETNQLSSYQTKVYKPVKVPCKKLLKVCQSQSGQELIFLLLFPEYPPKGESITILILDLKTMKLKDMRRDIPLTKSEYKQLLQQDVLSCDVSRVMGTTGSDYLFITLNGKVKVLSLNTGKLMLKTDNTDRFTNFAGQIVDEELLPLPSMSEVTTMSSASQLKSVFYSQNSTSLYMMKFRDDNSLDDRRKMFKCFQMWGGRKVTPVEMRIDTIPLTPGGNQPIDTFVTELVLELVDNALLRKKVPIPPDSQLANQKQAYISVAQQVFDHHIL